MTCIFTENVTHPQVFSKHFASENKLPGLSVSGILVKNELILKFISFILIPHSMMTANKRTSFLLGIIASEYKYESLGLCIRS